MINLYLAEDQAMLNSALTTILNLETDLDVIGSAEDGKTALAEINQLQPDIAILDIEMPGLTGLDVAEQLQTVNQRATRVLILTTFAQPSYFQRAVAAQVMGYLLKDSPSERLVGAVHDIMDGQTVYDPELVRGMYAAEQNPLTEQELAVLKAARTGQTTVAIAETVFLSKGTVRNYLSAIFSKLGVHNRLEALTIAEQNKWL
ncbi:response regulator transcription factor [Furfurilactobacillus entadae]|uniref:response regulator transcription factor n=1 Tax=Furfurilactobacillus entadae TaxID=2922307 RepID=UPI0035F0C86B